MNLNTIPFFPPHLCRFVTVLQIVLNIYFAWMDHSDIGLFTWTSFRGFCFEQSCLCTSWSTDSPPSSPIVGYTHSVCLKAAQTRGVSDSGKRLWFWQDQMWAKFFATELLLPPGELRVLKQTWDACDHCSVTEVVSWAGKASYQRVSLFLVVFRKKDHIFQECFLCISAVTSVDAVWLIWTKTAY